MGRRRYPRHSMDVCCINFLKVVSSAISIKKLSKLIHRQNFRPMHETTAEIYVIFTLDIHTDGRHAKTIVGGATCLGYVIKPS